MKNFKMREEISSSPKTKRGSIRNRKIGISSIWTFQKGITTSSGTMPNPITSLSSKPSSYSNKRIAMLRRNGSILKDDS